MLISDAELGYLAENLQRLADIPFYELDAAGNLIEDYSRQMRIFPTPLVQFVQELVKGMGDKKLCLESYSGLPISVCVYRTDCGRYFVWGPMEYQAMSSSERDSLIMKLKCDLRTLSIPGVRFFRLCAIVSLFAFSAERRELLPEEFNPENLSAYEPEPSLELHSDEAAAENNHTYFDEQRALEMLRSGNTEDIIKYTRQLMSLPYPQAVRGDSQKNEEYMAVAAVAIIARTAIECGVSAAESFRLSDLYFQKIAKCVGRRSILEVRQQALLEYAELVKRYNEQPKSVVHVENCKKIIKARVLEKISLDDIAEELGIGKAYLSKLFSEEEHMTVVDYIHREKLKIAKKLLKYSGSSVADIAAHLNFESQSYFGKLFKESEGISPREYRKQNRPTEY